MDAIVHIRPAIANNGVGVSNVTGDSKSQCARCEHHMDNADIQPDGISTTSSFQSPNPYAFIQIA